MPPQVANPLVSTFRPPPCAVVTPHEAAASSPPEACPDLRNGIDPGDPLTQKGRIKKRQREFFDPDDPDRYRYKAYHIRRAFDLFGHIPTIINDGIKRRAKEAAGEDASSIQTDRDFETFTLIANHLEGFNDDITRLQRSPKAFRALVRKIRDAADQARNNDTANLKKDIASMLTADGSSVLTVMMKGKKASSKHDRGFSNDVMGQFLCPISLDWESPSVRQDIREGRLSILAHDWPRLLYADCDCNFDDLEQGLGRNMALVRVVKYLFTGRSAAFSDTAGGKTTRSGNAALAGMKEITPRVVAYAACMLRYAISDEESWRTIDKEFNMQEFYWNVVDLFDDSGAFGRDLIAWWNLKVFGTGIDTTLKADTQPAAATLSILKIQRQAKRMTQRVLGDVTNTSNVCRTRSISPESEEETSFTLCNPRSSGRTDAASYHHQSAVAETDRPESDPMSKAHGQFLSSPHRCRLNLSTDQRASVYRADGRQDISNGFTHHPVSQSTQSRDASPSSFHPTETHRTYPYTSAPYFSRIPVSHLIQRQATPAAYLPTTQIGPPPPPWYPTTQQVGLPQA